MEKGLIIREQWLNLILSGRKTWEMRTKATKVRGQIGLIRAKSGLVVGVANLVDSKHPLSREEYMQHTDKHAIPLRMLDEVIENGWVHPWVLADVRPLPKPVRYVHKSGAVTFVKLDQPVSDAIAMQTSANRSEAVT